MSRRTRVEVVDTSVDDVLRALVRRRVVAAAPHNLSGTPAAGLEPVCRVRTFEPLLPVSDRRVRSVLFGVPMTRKDFDEPLKILLRALAGLTQRLEAQKGYLASPELQEELVQACLAVVRATYKNPPTRPEKVTRSRRA